MTPHIDDYRPVHARSLLPSPRIFARLQALLAPDYDAIERHLEAEFEDAFFAETIDRQIGELFDIAA